MNCEYIMILPKRVAIIPCASFGDWPQYSAVKMSENEGGTNILTTYD